MMPQQSMRAALPALIVYAVACAGTAACGSARDLTGPTSMQLVALTATTITGTVGSEIAPAPAVRVINQRGVAVAGVRVIFAMESGQGAIAGASATSDADGVAAPGRWVLGTLAGTSVLRASLSAAPSAAPSATVDFTATAVAGSVATIAPVSGDGQRGVVGEMLGDSLSVKVMDAFGNPIAGIDVTFRVLAGGGAIEGSTATTNGGGVASAGRWRLGPTASEQRIEATVSTVRLELSAIGYERCGTPCAPGASVAFVRDGDIYLTNVDGTALIQLTTGGNSGEPAWSPDGRRIAYTQATRFSTGIHLIDADGTNAREFAVDAAHPAWSPDGRQMAYSGRVNGEWRILVASMENGGKPASPIGFDRGYNAHPAWSPDGRKIAFVSDWEAFDFAMDVYVVNVDGSDLTQVSNGFFGSVPSWPTYTTYRQPAWSPDGRELALVTCREWQYYSCRASSLALMASDGSGLRTLATTSGYARPSWMSAESIAFSRSCLSDDSCAPNVFMFRLSDGSETLLVANGHSAAPRP